jgi:hypothetical protein
VGLPLPGVEVMLAVDAAAEENGTGAAAPVGGCLAAPHCCCTSPVPPPQGYLQPTDACRAGLQHSGIRAGV